MSKTMVINLTGTTQHVGVVHADGHKDDVQIMPRRRIELRTGMSVDPAWLGRNPGCVKVVSPQLVSPTVVAGRRPRPDPTRSAVTVADLQPEGTPAGALTVADLEAQATKEGEDK